MSECDEVADSLAKLVTRFYSVDDLRRFVRQSMPGQSEQVIDNVTESLWRRRPLRQGSLL